MITILKKHKMLLAMTLLVSIIFSAAAVGTAFVLQNILDAVTNGDWKLFYKMLWVVPIYILALGGMAFLNSIFTRKLIVKCVRDMRESIYNGILSRDTENFQSVNTADYISALTNDVKTVEANGLVPYLQALQYVFIFLMSAVALFYYSPVIAGLMFVSLLAMYLIPASLGKPISHRQDLLSRSFAAFTVSLKDQLSGYDVIRSFQLTERARDDFAKENNEITSNQFAVDKFTAASESLSQILGAGTQLLIMLVSAYMVMQGNMTAGVLLALLQLSGSFVQPVAVIMQSVPMIQGVKPIIERIQEISTVTSSSFKGSIEPGFEASISFDDVSFGYKPNQRVIEGLNLIIQKNRKYAVVGASGSGKSTLVKLLCANYGGYTGAISIDNKELHDLNIDKLLEQIALIHQNVYMFDETIKDNIDLHREYSETEWKHALETSGVDRFLPHMENGLDTPVGENGISLSGGQRQRIAVARALIKRKPILILDEGTSAVDAKTAYEIETSLLETSNITMITITHNLSPELLRQYDTILFMEDGKIAEAGSYDALLNAQGGFSEFIQIKEKEIVSYGNGTEPDSGNFISIND